MKTIAPLSERVNVPDRRCGYLAYHRAPRCERFATVHALVAIDGRGDIGMAACEAHRGALSTIGWIRDMHTFGPGCAHPVTTWGTGGCLPAM